jgi:hypothetical protein
MFEKTPYVGHPREKGRVQLFARVLRTLVCAPICVPKTSPELTISTRRFFFRPGRCCCRQRD